MFPTMPLRRNYSLCMHYECTSHRLADILVDKMALNGLSSARINFDRVEGLGSRETVMARFVPGSSIFMFTVLTPQWKVDKLIPKQPSEANTMGVELAPKYKMVMLEVKLVKPYTMNQAWTLDWKPVFSNTKNTILDSFLRQSLKTDPVTHMKILLNHRWPC